MKSTIFNGLTTCSRLHFRSRKSVKEAKSIANEVKPDFDQAEKLINGALTNTETKDNAETWDVAGFIQKESMKKKWKMHI